MTTRGRGSAVLAVAFCCRKRVRTKKQLNAVVTRASLGKFCGVFLAQGHLAAYFRKQCFFLVRTKPGGLMPVCNVESPTSDDITLLQMLAMLVMTIGRTKPLTKM